jgi:uncharacterized protein YjbI with pentapeptide repeats
LVKIGSQSPHDARKLESPGLHQVFARSQQPTILPSFREVHMTVAPRQSPVLRAARARGKPSTAPPDKNPLPDAIARINALISTSRATWLALLSYLAFIGVTLLGVEDADFFIEERQTDLPLIGVSVPTNLFFAIAPALGAMLATYLHLYLVKLWEALAEAPLPDADPSLADRIQPWELADFALSFRKGARTVETRPLGLLAWIVSLTLAFAATPLVLAAFWWRSMPKHDEALTVICCGIPLSFAIYSAVVSYLRLRGIMRGDDGPLFQSRSALSGWGVGFTALAVLGWLTTEGTFKAYAKVLHWPILVKTSWTVPDHLAGWKLKSLYEIEHERSRAQFEGSDWEEIDDQVERHLEASWWAQTWFPFLLVSADLRHVDFSYAPDGWRDFGQSRLAFLGEWCDLHGLALYACEILLDGAITGSGQEFSARNELCSTTRLWSNGPNQTSHRQRCAVYVEHLRNVFFIEWKKHRQNQLSSIERRDMSGHDLRGADLSWSNMVRVNLSEANLENAVLYRTQLEGAELSGSQLQHAYLKQARMEGADLSRANLNGSKLILAEMEWSNLSNAWIENAILSGVRMNGASLHGARMSQANFSPMYLSGREIVELGGAESDSIRSQMENVDLSFSNLQDTNFVSAWMEGAVLRSTRMDGSTVFADARLQGAYFGSVDLTSVWLEPEQIMAVFGDATVTLPGGVTPDHPDWPAHWPKGELDRDEFEKQYRLWQSDPATYTPPPPTTPVAPNP